MVKQDNQVKEAPDPSRQKSSEGRPGRKVWLAVLAVALAGGLAVAGIRGYPAWEESRAIARMVAAIRAGDDARVEEALAMLDQLNGERRQALAEEIEQGLIGYYERQILNAFHPEEQKYDFPRAEQIWTQALPLYRDSARLEEIITRSTEARNKLLSDLAGRFNEALEQGRILPIEDGEDVFDIIGWVGMVDPSSWIMTDRRLEDAFAREAKRAVDGGDLDLAARFVEKGLLVFSQNIALINIKDQIAGVQQAEAERQEAVRVAQGLRDRLTGVRALTEFAPLAEMVARLGELQPAHPLLAEAAEVASRLTSQRLLELLQGRDWDQARSLLSEAAPLIPSDRLAALLAQLDAEWKAHESRIEALSGRLSEALAPDSQTLPEASQILAEWESLAPEDGRLARGRILVVSAWIGRAREARNTHQWDLARELLDLARKQKLDEAIGKAVDLEREQIEAGQRLWAEGVATSDGGGERERLDRNWRRLELARQERIQWLGGQLDRVLGEPTFDRRSVKDVLGLLDQLAVLDPVPPEAVRGRVLARLVEEGDKLAAAGQFEEAINLLRDGLQAFPAAEPLAAALEKSRQARARAREQGVVGLRAEIDRLVVQAAMTPEWEGALGQKLREAAARHLDPHDPWLLKTRGAIAGIYVQRAQAMRADRRFALAKALMEKGAQYADGHPSLERERQAVAAAEKAFLQEAAQQAKLGEIEGLKQTLNIQTQANEVDLANKTLAKLRKELAAGDPFVARVAPESIARVYLRLAEKQARTEDFSAALVLVDKGLSMSKLPELDRASRIYRKAKEEQDGIRLSQAKEEERRRLEDEQERERELAEQRRKEREHIEQMKREVELAEQKRREEQGGAGETTDSLGKKPTKAEGFPSPRPCSLSLAGFGDNSRALCYDMLNATDKGPPLVVVPAGGVFAKGFAITQSEISIKDFNLYCEQSGECEPLPGKETLPVTAVTSTEAIRYAQWLSRVTGEEYRLPGDEEWVYSARAGDENPVKEYNCLLTKGSKVLKGKALSEVGTGETNAWGLKNHIGNVQEWVDGGTLVRGGGYRDAMSTCGISLQRFHDGQPDGQTGFRLVRTIPEAPRP